jgi:aspartate aminotransferase-like enzyme
VQACETSTGVYHPIRELAEITREHPERLIVLDGISGVGVHDLPMDAWGLDVVVSGSQKSWLLPPGLAFIALSARAREAVKTARCPRYYFDLRKELAAQTTDQTAWTAAVSLIVGLREALEMILDEGLRGLRAPRALAARDARADTRRWHASGRARFARVLLHRRVRARRNRRKRFVKHLRDAYDVTITGGRASLGDLPHRPHGRRGRIDMISAVAAIEMTLVDLGQPVRIGDRTRDARAASQVRLQKV